MYPVYIGTEHESALKSIISNRHSFHFVHFLRSMRLIPRRRNTCSLRPLLFVYNAQRICEASIFYFIFLISFAPLRDSGSARRPGSGKRSYKRKAEAALAFSTPVVREGEIKSCKKARCSGKRGGVEGGEKSFENYRRAAISPDGVLNFLPRGFTGRQLGPPASKKRIRTVSFASRCVFVKRMAHD